jgi:hypothetical protein
MAASNQTVADVYAIMVKYVAPEHRTAMLKELAEVRGNRSFEDTMKRLATLHAERTGDGDQ